MSIGTILIQLVGDELTCLLDLGQVELLHPFWLALQAATRCLKPLRSRRRGRRCHERRPRKQVAHAAVPIRGCRAVPLRAAPIHVLDPHLRAGVDCIIMPAASCPRARGSFMPRRRNVGSARSPPPIGLIRLIRLEWVVSGEWQWVHVWVHPGKGRVLQGHASHASHDHNNVPLLLNRAFCSQEKYARRALSAT